MTVLKVYRARFQDQAQVLRLLRNARRSFAAFGLEDLSGLVARGDVMVASDDQDRVHSCLVIAVNSSGWAFLRGAAITNGWRTDDGLDAVLGPTLHRLAERQVTHLAAYGTALWLVPALMRADFSRQDWIVTLERHPRPLPSLPPAPLPLRPVVAGDRRALVALDEAVFQVPYRLDSGGLVELMVTTGHLVVAHDGDRLLGYACADVLGEEAQIIRLAVHPHFRRQGLGRALLNDALAYCQANGARSVTINTQEDNTASLVLYEGFGFRRVGRRVPLLVRALAGSAQ